MSIYVNDPLIDNALKFVLGETKPDKLDEIQKNIAKFHIACILPIITNNELTNFNLAAEECKVPNNLVVNYSICQKNSDTIIPYVDSNNNLIVFNSEQITSILKEIKDVIALTNEAEYTSYKTKSINGGKKSHTKKQK